MICGRCGHAREAHTGSMTGSDACGPCTATCYSYINDHIWYTHECQCAIFVKAPE